MINKNISLPIYLSRPNIDEQDISSVIEVLRSGNLVQGEKVLKLEDNINEYLGTKYCSAVSNGTASLHLALVTLGIGPGDEVIIPAFSYIATSNVIELVGATPIFIDINSVTFNINASKIEEKITKRTKCIMPVHEFGLCADMDSIIGLAKKHKLFIIEDAACAIGAKYKNKYAGTFGHFASFSLHPRKSITCGEGGLIITNSDVFDKKIKTLRNHGIEPNSYPANFISAGFNYRLTDFQAAMVNSQMRRLDLIINKKSSLVKIYFENLREDIIKLPTVPKDYKHAWQTFHVVVNSHENRNKLIDFLKENQVFCNYGAQCIPEMSFYKKKYKLNCKEDFPNAFESYTCGLALPLGENSTEDEIYYVCELINKFKND